MFATISCVRCKGLGLLRSGQWCGHCNGKGSYWAEVLAKRTEPTVRNTGHRRVTGAGDVDPDSGSDPSAQRSE